MIFRGHRVKNEKKTISNPVVLRRCGSVVVQRDRNISNRLPHRPRAAPMPNGHSLFFPECPRKHPVYVPPSDCYQIHPQQPQNENKGSCSDPAIWGHVYEKLSHPLETIIGTEKETVAASDEMLLDSVWTNFPEKMSVGQNNYIHN